MSATGRATPPQSRPGGPFCGPPGAPKPPGGTSWFPPSLRRSTASKGRFFNPLVVPEVAQLNHSYTSITRGRALPPRGSGTASQSRARWPRAPSAPRAGSACCSCACCAGATPDSRAAGAAAIHASSALGSHAAGAATRGAAVRVGGRLVWRLGLVGGRSGPPCRGRCCRGGGGGGPGAPAYAGYGGGCTVPPGRPVAGATRSPSLALRLAPQPRPPRPALSVSGGLHRPSTPYPWAPFRPLDPGSGAAPPPCPHVLVACPDLRHPRPCAFR